MFLWLLPAGQTLKVTAREKLLIKVTWSHDFLALTLRLSFTSDICLLVSCWHTFPPPGDVLSCDVVRDEVCSKTHIHKRNRN